MDENLGADSSLHTYYRPTAFAGVIGQNTTIKSLEAQLKSDALPHVFCFVGESGVGKSTLARILATRLGATPDTIEIIDATQFSGVDSTRELTYLGNFLPIFGHRKVMIIEEAHMFSTAAWNPWLLACEEPPPHMFYIFTTTEEAKIPKAIKTRCHLYHLNLIPAKEIEAYLGLINEQEALGLDIGTVQECAVAAGGSMRQALVNLSKVKGLSIEEVAEALQLARSSDKDPLIQIAQLVLRQEKEFKAYLPYLKAVENWGGARKRWKYFFGQEALKGGSNMGYLWRILDALDKVPAFPSDSDGPADAALFIGRCIV